MKFHLAIFSLLVLVYLAYAQTQPPKSECACDCDQKNDSGSPGLPYDPCNNMPKNLCSLLWETCRWESSKCAFRFWPADRSQSSKPNDRPKTQVDGIFPDIPGFNGTLPNIPRFGNGTFPNIPGFNGTLPNIPRFGNGTFPNIPSFNGTLPNIPGMESLPDPCRRNSVNICLILREVCKWNSEKDTCQFRWLS